MIYKNQTSLRIRLTTSVDITGSTLREVRYRTPSGSTGGWSATSEDDTTGIIYYDTSSGDLNEAGDWIFWAFVTFSDGRSAPGEPVKVPVALEGEIT